METRDGDSMDDMYPPEMLAQLFEREARILLNYDKDNDTESTAEEKAARAAKLRGLQTRINGLLIQQGQEESVKKIDEAVGDFLRQLMHYGDAAVTIALSQKKGIAPEILEEARAITAIPIEAPDFFALQEGFSEPFIGLGQTYIGVQFMVADNMMEKYTNGLIATAQDPQDM